MMDWSWSIIIKSIPQLLDGAWLTVQLVVLSGLAGLLLAVPVSLLRLSKSWWIKAIPYAYIYFFRGTPLLIQIYLIYFGLAQFDWIRESAMWSVLSSAYWCAIIAFTLNTCAYISEIFRGAISSIPVGELEAADALGFSRIEKIRRIILPRAFGMMIPAYSNEVIFMLKNSALAYTITLMELTKVMNEIRSRTLADLELFFAAGVIYIVLAWMLLAGFSWLEKKFNPQRRGVSIQ